MHCCLEPEAFFSVHLMNQNASTVLRYYLSSVKAHVTKYRKGVPYLRLRLEKQNSRTITLRSDKARMC